MKSCNADVEFEAACPIPALLTSAALLSSLVKVTAFGKELVPKGKPAGSGGVLGGISNFFKKVTGGNNKDGPR